MEQQRWIARQTKARAAPLYEKARALLEETGVSHDVLKQAEGITVWVVA